jgi:hypothetical protein
MMEPLTTPQCDEIKPVCNRCQRNERHCLYSGGSTSRDEGLGTTRNTIILERNDHGVLQSNPNAPILLISKHGTPAHHLLSHCHNHWHDILPIRPSEIFSAFNTNPLIHHVALALSASHLRHLSPDPRHRIAEYYQQSLAIREYKALLTTPSTHLSQKGVNELLLGGTLLSILAFPLPASEPNLGDGRRGGGDGAGEHDITQSWVFSSRGDRLGWLRFQAGLRPLLKSMDAYLDEANSFLSELFLGETVDGLGIARGGGEKLLGRWREFFGLRIADDGKGKGDREEALKVPIRVVTYLRGVQSTERNVFLHLMFLAKANPNFCQLLYDKDEKALWLYGYWFGLMCRFEDTWWSRQRVRRDYEAIVYWLTNQHHSPQSTTDADLWRDMMIELKDAPIQPRCTSDAPD